MEKMGDEFTKARSMEFPRNVLIGHDIVTDIVPLSKHLNFLNTGMIISGSNTYKSAGSQIKDLLTDDGYSISDFMTGEATLSNVEKAIEHAKETKSKFIVAVGGGSKIDIAKMVASKLNIPFISVPTSAAHDGIASNRASLKADMGPKSVEAVTPTAILADTKLISDAPYRYLASGCADVISNLTALKDWDYAHRLRAEPFSSSAHSLSLHAANTIMENAKMIKPNSEESVWLAMRPIIISGISMAVAGSSRPTSGSEHMFSHALDIMHPGKAMHGEQCGVGCIMMMYLHGGDWKSIRNALMKIGAPVNATDLGLKNDDIVDALMTAHKIRPDRFTILGDNGLNRESAENIAKLTMVIE
ncbi:MAG: NAD(P)-dependent glycerol-1-phosphate dehydrogenase [Candidatus Methanomethylophilaceae archaeon]|nr:NAD(P)-dependent glycerol-1-phosphate dehydrogenase [Candidatus Methanomethylophilaceae archaeon]